MRTALVAAVILAACPVPVRAQVSDADDLPRAAGVRSRAVIGRPAVAMPRTTSYTNPARSIFEGPTWGRNATSSLSGGSIYNPQKSRANGDGLDLTGTISITHRRSRNFFNTFSCGCFSRAICNHPFPYGFDRRLIGGELPGSRLAFPAPTPAPEPAPEPLSMLEQARVLLAVGEIEAAVERYQRHLVGEGEDFLAAAELGVALIEAGRLDDGVAMIAYAYSRDPALGSWPVSDRIQMDGRRWRRGVVRAVQHANRRDSASAWLAVAVLMQGEGRKDVARRMLDRSIDRGLDASIAGAMRAVLP
jgi:hypothetical protein